MRFVVARRSSRRGEGLGNELLPLAKGFLASQVLDATQVGPSWGINKRQYWRSFGTNRLDFVLEDMLRALPHHHFRAEDYYATGKLPFGEAVHAWALAKGLLGKHFVVEVDGMYGGYPAIWQARSFLLSRLLTSQHALRNVYLVESAQSRERLTIAVHMRLGGDFNVPQPGENVRGRFNIRLPLAWYMSVCRALRQSFGAQLEFRFYADRKGPDYQAAVAEFNPGQKEFAGATECGDLLLMANADLRVCSVSSFSMSACFLGDGPYLWYEPQLDLEDGTYSLWGHEERQRLPGSPTRLAADSVQGGRPASAGWKGFPVAADAVLPPELVEQLHHRLAMKDRRRNLLAYGCVPAELLAPMHVR